MGASKKDIKAQQNRSKKWGIEVREDGNVNKPSEYASVPDEQFLDPVNYAYPVDTRARALAAVRYWGVEANREKYGPESRAIIDERADAVREKYRIGDFNKGRVIKTFNDQQIFWAIALEPGTADKRDLQEQWVSAEEIEKAAHLFMANYQTAGLMHEGITPDVVIVESAIAPVDMVVNGEPVYKGSWWIAGKVHSAEIWKGIRGGEYTGVSVGGRAKIVPDEGVDDGAY